MFKKKELMVQNLSKQYPIVISQSVVWGDMDAYGHVNNTKYFRYFEDVRIAYLDAVGVTELKNQSNIGPIVAKTECNYLLPLTFPDNIEIATNVILLSEKKFKMNYVVYSHEFERVAAKGSALIVFYDYNQNKSCNIPAKIVDAIENLEAGNES